MSKQTDFENALCTVVHDHRVVAAKDMRERAARVIRALNIGLTMQQIRFIERRIRALPIDAAQEGE